MNTERVRDEVQDDDTEGYETIDEETGDGDDTTTDVENPPVVENRRDDNPFDGLLTPCDERACDAFQATLSDEKLMKDLDCFGCCCPEENTCKAGIIEEVILLRESKKRDEARKRLVKALEDSGVQLPIAGFETMLNPGNLSNALGCGNAADAETVRGNDDNGSYDAGLNPIDGDNKVKSSPRKALSTAETDEESNSPDDQIEIEIPRLPLGSISKGGVIVVETDDKSEVLDTSHVKLALVPKNSKRVTMIFPRDKRLRRAGIAFCCFLLLLLVVLIVVVAVRRNDDSAASDVAPPVGSANNDTATMVPYLGDEGATSVPTAEAESNTTTSTETPTIVVSEEECADSILPDARCYPRGQQIVVMFVNCQPREGDWLGIWDANTNRTELGNDAADWMWACGNKQCVGVVETNLVAFLNFYQEGTYRLHLIRGIENEPYSAYASSDTFEVKTNPVDCMET